MEKVRWKNEYGFAINSISKNCVHKRHTPFNRQLNFQGKLKFKETKYKGFEQMAQAMVDLFNGKNTGKVVIES
ncbi:MAG: hypothetical protein GY696_40620 [Gammaproteobacteria bacterium]|nr:hypothetical protein [Gammaproteobacteria bacterium]